MNLTLSYLGRSLIKQAGANRVVCLSPNLGREKVAFDAPLEQPLRFREAISALHDVVISDLRFKARDKTAYEQWKRAERARESLLARQAYDEAKEEILARRSDKPAPDLEREYNRCRRRYWKARWRYSSYLSRHDPALWRQLMPCDPVITVADDVVFFECFSADESSYGCLTVDRSDGFGHSSGVSLGTTNVDYSWELYNHFQTLRSYRETRFQVDPEGFEVATQDHVAYREEKIDLPPGWLRGFLQIQAAMGLPMRRVSLSREAVYSTLAWLKRHRARTSPRALRFELADGPPPRLVLEPWEQPVVSHRTVYRGDEATVRVWGQRRLLVLARLLPLVEGIDVYLLGTGLPSFWVARMGEMRLTLGLSGWTVNDWTRGSALDALAPPRAPSAMDISRVAKHLAERRSGSLEEIRRGCLMQAGTIAATLNHLAHTGQVICDIASGVYRWRQVMPTALGEEQIGPENPELAASREIIGQRGRRGVTVESSRDAPRGLTLHVGKIDGKSVEVLVDVDGAIRRGKCSCRHHFKAGLRMGPCRHLLALRAVATRDDERRACASNSTWYDRWTTWAGR